MQSRCVVLWMIHYVPLCISIYHCVSIRYISTLLFWLSFLSVLILTPRSLPSCLQLLRALWRPNPCLSFYFSICLCFTMPAPVPIGTLWLQTSLVLRLPLVGRRPHYFVPGVWCGRGVSATRSPDTPPPSKRKT